MTAFSPDFDVIGLYDGRVRVPFAHVSSLHPYLVSTLSHELARAFGTDLAAFDFALREWSRTEAPTTWPTELRRYDQELDSPLARAGITRGSSAGAASPPRWARRPKEAMTEWHRRYASRVAALRRALGPAIDEVRRGAIAPDGACVRVGSAAAGLLAERATLASPDPAPGDALRSAFEGFRRMATACRDRDLGAARREMAAAEAELRRAATLLEPYGLRP